MMAETAPPDDSRGSQLPQDRKSEGGGAPELGPRVALAFLAALALVEHAADDSGGGGLPAATVGILEGLPAFRRFYLGALRFGPPEQMAAVLRAQRDRREDAEKIVLQVLLELYKNHNGG